MVCGLTPVLPAPQTRWLIGAGSVRRAPFVRSFAHAGRCFFRPSMQLIAVEEGPDEEKDERDRAQGDRDIDEQELAGNAPRDEYAHRDDHEGRAEPDHWRSPQNARPTPAADLCDTPARDGEDPALAAAPPAQAKIPRALGDQ